LENVIYLQLIRSENTVYYAKNKYECDFVVQQNGRVTQAIQVCLTLADETTRQREIRGLIQALKQFDLSEGTIVTLDEEKEMDVEGRKIIVRPSWKWLVTQG